MTFMDDDLKRLKENCLDDTAVGSFVVLALIARLEAAERVCLWDKVMGYAEFLKRKLAWRKTAGK